MSYIASESIKVFPLSKNRPTDRNARLFYENNIANIIRQLIDVDGFIIKTTDTDNLKDKLDIEDVGTFLKIQLQSASLKFNLHGYYFDIGPYGTGTSVNLCTLNKPEVTESGDSYDVYAVVTINTTSNEIAESDEGTEYKGLSLEIVPKDEALDIITREDVVHYKLKLFTFTIEYDNGWKITEAVAASESYSKLKSSSLETSINIIDGRPLAE